jgi:hypothetical protein
MTSARKSKTQKGRRKSSVQAPDQYLGYSLQTNRLLTNLLQADPGSVVSLEVFEDVGVDTQDGFRIAEQDKSALVKNPIADRSVDLWKTLSNWIDAVESGELEVEKTTFIFHVSKLKKGAIAEKFSKADSLTEARIALHEAKYSLWGVDPDYRLKDRVADSIKEYVSRVFDTMDKDEGLVCGVVKNLSLSFGGGSSIEDLKRLMKKTIIPDDILDDALDYILGWVKEQTDALLEQRKPAFIAYDSFHTALTSFVRKHDRRTILDSFAKAPDEDQIKSDLNIRTYVRQLDLIECDDDQRIEAVRDYLQSSADRTEWSLKGWVNETSFDELENDLIRTWKNLKSKMEIELDKQEDIRKGKYLYALCSLHKAKLQGLEVPYYFTPGSFHAVSDKELIGWHPEYKARLKALAKSK